MKDIDIKELGIKIRQKKLRKPKLGYYNPKTLTIVINSDQSEVQKHSTLIHEFIHAVDHQLQAMKVSKRPIPHRTIESLAPNLLVLFSLAGLWRGVSNEFNATRSPVAALSYPVRFSPNRQQAAFRWNGSVRRPACGEA